MGGDAGDVVIAKDPLLWSFTDIIGAVKAAPGHARRAAGPGSAPLFKKNIFGALGANARNQAVRTDMEKLLQRVERDANSDVEGLIRYRQAARRHAQRLQRRVAARKALLQQEHDQKSLSSFLGKGKRMVLAALDRRGLAAVAARTPTDSARVATTADTNQSSPVQKDAPTDATVSFEGNLDHSGSESSGDDNDDDNHTAVSDAELDEADYETAMPPFQQQQELESQQQQKANMVAAQAARNVATKGQPQLKFGLQFEQIAILLRPEQDSVFAFCGTGSGSGSSDDRDDTSAAAAPIGGVAADHTQSRERQHSSVCRPILCVVLDVATFRFKKGPGGLSLAMRLRHFAARDVGTMGISAALGQQRMYSEWRKAHLESPLSFATSNSNSERLGNSSGCSQGLPCEPYGGGWLFQEDARDDGTDVLALAIEYPPADHTARLKVTAALAPVRVQLLPAPLSRIFYEFVKSQPTGLDAVLELILKKLRQMRSRIRKSADAAGKGLGLGQGPPTADTLPIQIDCRATSITLAVPVDASGPVVVGCVPYIATAATTMGSDDEHEGVTREPDLIVVEICSATLRTRRAGAPGLEPRNRTSADGQRRDGDQCRQDSQVLVGASCAKPLASESSPHNDEKEFSHKRDSRSWKGGVADDVRTRDDRAGFVNGTPLMDFAVKHCTAHYRVVHNRKFSRPSPDEPPAGTVFDDSVMQIVEPFRINCSATYQMSPMHVGVSMDAVVVNLPLKETKAIVRGIVASAAHVRRSREAFQLYAALDHLHSLGALKSLSQDHGQTLLRQFASQLRSVEDSFSQTKVAAHNVPIACESPLLIIAGDMLAMLQQSFGSTARPLPAASSEGRTVRPSHETSIGQDSSRARPGASQNRASSSTPPPTLTRVASFASVSSLATADSSGPADGDVGDDKAAEALPKTANRDLSSSAVALQTRIREREREIQLVRSHLGWTMDDVSEVSTIPLVVLSVFVRSASVSLVSSVPEAPTKLTLLVDSIAVTSTRRMFDMATDVQLHSLKLDLRFQSANNDGRAGAKEANVNLLHAVEPPVSEQQGTDARWQNTLPSTSHNSAVSIYFGTAHPLSDRCDIVFL